MMHGGSLKLIGEAGFIKIIGILSCLRCSDVSRKVRLG